MSDPGTLLWLVPAFPLAAGILIAFLGPVLLRKHSHWPAILGVACSFGCSLLVLSSLQGITGYHPEFHTQAVTWFAIDNFTIHFGLQADTLTAIMLVAVTFCGTFIVIFSSWYMRNEDGYPRFFAIMSLFLFSMTGLVLANNFIALYAFWEGVGLCSYLLIGFWFAKPSAAAAARKAFLVTRFGDAGLILGIMLLWSRFGHSLDMEDVFLRANSNPDYITAVCLLLLCGAVGKSAQFPLHVWLPDAMEGPTPVSALIHAATMVTAGVYVVARCSPLFVLSPEAQLVVAIIGGFTALLAAAIALTQYDLKRVLAYSTMSQLGFMFLGLGAGLREKHLIVLAASAAIFHLFTHAFFKSLLFLSAGSVMVAMGHVIDMRRFSGLRKVLPVTHWTFLCGALALAALIPLSGFWSKDLIMDAVMEASESSSPYRTVYLILLISALITAAMTAFYIFRAYWLTFHGELKIPKEAFEHAGDAHSELQHRAHAGGEMERPKNFEMSMAQKVPLIVLAICAFFIGLACEGFWHWITNFLGRSTAFTVDMPERHINWLMMAISTIVALAGIGVATWMYYWHRGVAKEVAAKVPKLYEWSLHRFFFDELYGYLIIGPLNAWAQISRFLDAIVDGIVDLVGMSPRFLARFLQLIQNGLVQFYALVMIVFVTAFMTIWVIWFGR
ncbi:MAG TPA: NADH-quinone oxidoreductase subunit L [Gemmataceae bacterium]|jgi:NADH-quinone oxidoreductase subunit L|nr:NADH-quinone oxidoreductase subunit L [Gemmataceae bacterium]